MVNFVKAEEKESTAHMATPRISTSLAEFEA